VVLDIAPLEALLTRTFSIGLDVGRGREKVALVRLRLSRALPGAAETQAMAAGALAIERGVATEQIAAAEGWRCTPPRSTGCRTRCCTWRAREYRAPRLGQDTGRPGPGGRLAMGEALIIEARQERGCAIVTVAGEIDIATATRLRERLFELAAGGRPLVADQVSFIDSAGLSALVGAAKRAAAHGGSLHVVCARPKIRQLFRLTGLDRRLMPARTLDEALDALLAARSTPR
jgi:anti-sigma B factor antagonist